MCRHGAGYVVLLSQLSLITVRPSLSLHPHQPVVRGARRTAVSCPSSSASQACTCSVDLVVRCRGQTVTEVPRFPADVGRVFAELNMAGANVRHLHPDDFLGLRLHRVVLTGNRLSDRLGGDAVFSSLGNHLTSLMLGACAIRSLPPRLLFYVTRLEVLHLWGNHVELIPDSFFVANSELRELSLWGNRLRSLDNGTFLGLVRVRVLDLDRNRITTIEPGAMSHVAGALEVLRLSHNHVSALSDSVFTDLRRLRILTLASNRLRFIDARTFVGLRRLQTLCLANNHIQFLADAAFQQLTQLRTLDLSGNRLERVWAGTFVGLGALTSVDLSGNRLSRLPEATFGQSPALRRLTLEDNRLSTLARCTLSSHATISSISVIGNVIECDCRMAWIASATTTIILGNCVSDQHHPVVPVHKTSSYVDNRFCPLDTHHPCLL